MPPNDYTADTTMDTLSARVANDADSQAAEQQRFFKNATFPTETVVLFADPGPHAKAPVSSPPLLVVLVDSHEIDRELRQLLTSRASFSTVDEWHDQISGKVGWSILAAATGDLSTDAMNSYAKLNLNITAPANFNASYVFHLGQTLEAVAAICNGGLFAIATPDLIQHLGPQTFGDALEALPVFSLPRSTNLTQVVNHLTSAD